MFEDLFAKPVAGIDPALVFWQAVIASVLATLLGLVIAFTYKHTHRGTSYSQGFGQVLIVMAIVVGLVMIVIGSNIARAFSLVGALSIIRYRTAVKDARDTMFVFFAMMMGMACGVGLREVAVFGTLFICLVIWLLVRLNVGGSSGEASILKVRVPVGQAFEETINPYLQRTTDRFSVISTESVRQGTALEVTYQVVLKDAGPTTKFVEEIKKRNGNDRVLLFPDPSAVSES